MSRNTRKDGESIFSLILAALGLFIVIVSLTIGFGTLKNPGSGLFPFLVGALILVQSLVVFSQKRPAAEGGSFTRREVKYLLAMTATFCVWILLMPLLGYVLVTFVVVFAFSKLLNLEGWIKPMILSFGTTGVCYVLFDLLMYLDLPRGFLG
jgi:putative tricarboxylic transport membrane protein